MSTILGSHFLDNETHICSSICVFLFPTLIKNIILQTICCLRPIKSLWNLQILALPGKKLWLRWWLLKLGLTVGWLPRFGPFSWAKRLNSCGIFVKCPIEVHLIFGNSWIFWTSTSYRNGIWLSTSISRSDHSLKLLSLAICKIPPPLGYSLPMYQNKK